MLNILWFLFGQALHVAAQVDAIARAKNNPIDSRAAILKARATAFIVRIGLSSAVFVLWLQGTLIEVIMATGLTVPDSIEKVLNLHVTGAIAVLAGFAADSVLGYIPFLKSSIPPPPEDK
jgi:hypothetical protein